MGKSEEGPCGVDESANYREIAPTGLPEVTEVTPIIVAQNEDPLAIVRYLKSVR